MSNPNELDIRIKAIYDAKAQMDQAVRDLKAVQAETRGLGPANREAGGATAEHASQALHLEEALGLNRRSLGMGVAAVEQLTGANKELGMATEVLMNKLSPATLGVAGLSAVVVLGKQAFDAHVASLKEEQGILAQGTMTLQEYKTATTEVWTETLLMAEAQNVLSKGIGGAAANMAHSIDAMDQIAAAEMKLGALQHEAALGIVESGIQHVLTAKTAGDHASAILKLAEAYAPLNFAGKQWNELLPEQQAAMVDLAKANVEYASFASDAANRTVTFTDASIDNARAVEKQTEDLRYADIELGKVAGTSIEVTDRFGNLISATYDASGAFHSFATAAAEVNQNMPGGMSGGGLDMKKFLGDESYRNNIKAGQDAQAAQDKAIADAKREADAVAKFQMEMAEASQVAGPRIAANFQLIAHSAGDAALKTQELRAYINSLPKDVKAKIDLAIQFGGNMALANQLGMGGGAQPASRDWMKEFDATFAEQKGDIQQKFVQDAGGNKDKAQQTWQQQHRMELQGAMLQDAGQFTNAQGGAADMQKALMDPLKTIKMSDPLMAGVKKDDKGLAAVGDAMGALIGKQAAARVTDAMGDSASDIAKALFGMMDGRYQRIPLAYVPPSG